jgi:RND superfamily putative drug exporter
LAFVAALVGVAGGATYSGNNSVDTESSRAAALLNNELPQGPGSFVLVAGSATLPVDDPRFRADLDAALAPLAADPNVTAVTTPYDRSGSLDQRRVSADRHHALTTVSLVSGGSQIYLGVRARISSPSLQLVATGGAPVNVDYDTITNADAARGEHLSIPLSLILLFLVFGSIVAACLPLAVALFATFGGLATLAALTRVMDVDSSAQNVAIFLGLGLGIDYSLFIVSRFREELGKGSDVEEALAVTFATAGTAITVSGLTVAIGFSGLLFFTHTWLFAFGLGVMSVVILSVLAALTILPAVLSLLGPNVDRGRLWRRRQRADEHGIWHRLATAVMRHPVAVLVPSVALLLLPVVSFSQIKTGTDHLTDLPTSAESRQGAELLGSQFPQTAQTSVAVVVHWPRGPVLTADRIGTLYDLHRALSAVPGALRVDSIVPVDAGLTREQLQALYTGPPEALPQQARDALRASVGTDIAALRVVSSATERSVAARDLVAAVRGADSVPGADVLVTGATAFDVDFVAYIDSRIPLAIGFVVLATYVVLFLLFGSVLLPLKAVAMNLLSITASFGALTWVFQQGHLSGLLGFTPAPIDPVLPVILFCVLFGLSMDYEVFLLTRIQEEHRRLGDTRLAVAAGLERNGQLVTGAALIMIAVTASFGFADVVVVKIVGLGAALAILVDATIVRGLVVPALMCLMGEANWWAPRPLLAARRQLGSVAGAAAGLVRRSSSPVAPPS